MGGVTAEGVREGREPRASSLEAGEEAVEDEGQRDHDDRSADDLRVVLTAWPSMM